MISSKQGELRWWQRGATAAEGLCKGQRSELSIQPCSVALRVTGTKPQGFRAVNGSGRVLLEPWACFGVVLLRDRRAGSQVGAAGRELTGSTMPGPKLGQGHPPWRAALPFPRLCKSCSACTLTTMIHRGFLEEKKKNNTTTHHQSQMNAFCVRTARVEGLLEAGMAKLGEFLPSGDRRVPSAARWLVGTQRCLGQCSASPASSFIPAKTKESSIYPSRAGGG